MADNRNVAAEIVAKKMVRPRLRITYPLVERLKDTVAQKVINYTILQQVYEMLAQQGYAHEPGMEVTGGYEVKLNRKGILSLTLENYAYAKGAAHGLTLRRAVTANLENGEIYRLKDLFSPESDYRTYISDIIRRQIKERDIPLIHEFHKIGEDQDYFLTDTAVVVFFQLYEYTPYVYGFPSFEIPLAQLKDIMNKQGPLPRLMK